MSFHLNTARVARTGNQALGLVTDGQRVIYYQRNSESANCEQPIWVVRVDSEEIGGPYVSVNSCCIRGTTTAYAAKPQGRVVGSGVIGLWYIYKNGEQVAGPFSRAPRIWILPDGRLFYIATPPLVPITNIGGFTGNWSRIFYMADGTYYHPPYKEDKTYYAYIDGDPLPGRWIKDSWPVPKIDPLTGNIHYIAEKEDGTHAIFHNGTQQDIPGPGEFYSARWDNGRLVIVTKDGKTQRVYVDGNEIFSSKHVNAWILTTLSPNGEHSIHHIHNTNHLQRSDGSEVMTLPEGHFLTNFFGCDDHGNAWAIVKHNSWSGEGTGARCTIKYYLYKNGDPTEGPYHTVIGLRILGGKPHVMTSDSKGHNRLMHVEGKGASAIPTDLMGSKRFHGSLILWNTRIAIIDGDTWLGEHAEWMSRPHFEGHTMVVYTANHRQITRYEVTFDED